MTAANNTMFRLPFFVISHPQKGNVIKDPIGMANNTEPKLASERWKYCWMFGIREAQLEKHNPCKKKKALTATRLIRGLFWFIWEYLKRESKYKGNATIGSPVFMGEPEKVINQKDPVTRVFLSWHIPYRYANFMLKTWNDLTFKKIRYEVIVITN